MPFKHSHHLIVKMFKCIILTEIIWFTITCLLWCIKGCIFSPQSTPTELKSSHKQHSLSHKNHETFSLKVMASSYMFQWGVYQQGYQKHSWMCKSVYLVSFRCLLTVSCSVPCTGCTVPTSSQSPLRLRYSTVVYCLMISNVHSLPLFQPNALRKSYHTYSKHEMEVFLVTTVRMVAYLYPSSPGLE